jgi:hypothetical protein
VITILGTIRTVRRLTCVSVFVYTFYTFCFTSNVLADENIDITDPIFSQYYNGYIATEGNQYLSISIASGNYWKFTASNSIQIAPGTNFSGQVYLEKANCGYRGGLCCNDSTGRQCSSGLACKNYVCVQDVRGYTWDWNRDTSNRSINFDTPGQLLSYLQRQRNLDIRVHTEGHTPTGVEITWPDDFPTYTWPDIYMPPACNWFPPIDDNDEHMQSVNRIAGLFGDTGIVRVFNNLEGHSQIWLSSFPFFDTHGYAFSSVEAGVGGDSSLYAGAELTIDTGKTHTGGSSVSGKLLAVANQSDDYQGPSVFIYDFSEADRLLGGGIVAKITGLQKKMQCLIEYI